jgi:formamidopyrimidine-DNA glycosylase
MRSRITPLKRIFMPELPEVETIRTDLEKNVVGRTITDVAFLWDGILKDMSSTDFNKIVVGKKFVAIKRRAKNIYVELTDGIFLLFHMKMTGHLIYTDDCWKVDEKGKWIHQAQKESPMYDPLNQYIRMIFYLDNKKILAFSDLRKFAYLKLLDQKGIDAALASYGPEPLGPDFTLKYLTDILGKKKVAIKKVLMDQTQIAGIGNIYADEILFKSKIHPLTAANLLDDKEIKKLHTTIVEILTLAVKMRGTSTSDFRDTEGKKGKFGETLAVYRRTNLPCPNDGTPIKRIVVGGRGTHFCPLEQVQK